MNKDQKTSSEIPLETLKKEAVLGQLLSQENQLNSKDDIIRSQERKILELEATVNQLKDYLRQAHHNRFGRKSEKLSEEETLMLPGIGQVFDEAAPDIPPKRRVKKNTPSGGRKPLPEKLPREKIIHDLPEEKKVCSCGHKLHCIGEKTSEQLEIIPAKVKVLHHVCLRYACKGCEETMILTKMPPQPLPKSMAAPGLLSHILVSKYDDHLPLYRQAEIWQRSGIDFDCSTLGRWVIKCGNLLKPLVDLMQKEILASPYIQADETTVQVLKEKGRKPSSKSYMWVYKTGGNENYKIVYQYAPTRSADVASLFLKGFKGHLQSDGYTGYTKVSHEANGAIRHLGCWAHARRKFVDIVKISTKKGIAFQVVEKIAKLYEIEKRAREEALNFKEIKKRRAEESGPILTDLKVFLEKHQLQTPPKSTLGNAIGYTLRHWEELIVYLEKGHLAIDNNATERCIKPFAVGRKNWTFKGSVEGAEASAIIYSLLESVKSYGHNPYDYFKDILTKIPKKILQNEALDELLPDNWKPKLDNT